MEGVSERSVLLHRAADVYDLPPGLSPRLSKYFATRLTSGLTMSEGEELGQDLVQSHLTRHHKYLFQLASPSLPIHAPIRSSVD